VSSVAPLGHPPAEDGVLTLLPTFEYRVIFMERNLREVLPSQQKMLQRQGRSGLDMFRRVVGCS